MWQRGRRGVKGDLLFFWHVILPLAPLLYTFALVLFYVHTSVTRSKHSLAEDS
jgi:hypothetical protein